jgi:NADH-quinone oxidoreductase subunit J
VLYTDYIFLFQGAGLILLVAMIGAIVLTHRDRLRSRRQDIGVQVSRRTQLDMASVPLGASIGELGILRPLPPEEEKPKAVAHDDHGHGGHH